MDDACHLKQKVICQFRHIRPVADIRTIDHFHILFGFLEAVIDRIFIDLAVEVVLWIGNILPYVFRTRQFTAVKARCSNAAGIHEGNTGELVHGWVRAFAVREVARCVANGEFVVGRCIAGAKARSAKSTLYADPVVHEGLDGPGFHEAVMIG